MFPHERSLVKDYANRPFAIIGVNADPDLAELKELNAKAGIRWRSFWAGPKGAAGPIPTEWQIEGWPTVYLLDHRGVIRHKNLQGKELDAAIAALVEAAERDASIR